MLEQSMLVSVAGDCSAATHACYVVTSQQLCMLAFVVDGCSTAMHACFVIVIIQWQSICFAICVWVLSSRPCNICNWSLLSSHACHFVDDDWPAVVNETFVVMAAQQQCMQFWWLMLAQQQCMFCFRGWWLFHSNVFARKWSKVKPSVGVLVSHFASNQSHPPSLLSAKDKCMVQFNFYLAEGTLKKAVCKISTRFAC